jgi:hypothetical protein
MFLSDLRAAESARVRMHEVETDQLTQINELCSSYMMAGKWEGRKLQICVTLKTTSSGVEI